jgi:hypothetical protein
MGRNTTAEEHRKNNILDSGKKESEVCGTNKIIKYL